MLAQQQEVPADASVLIVAGPTTDFLAPETRDAPVRTWPAAASCSCCSIRPRSPKGRDLTSLLALAKEWGIEPGTNIVVDASGVGQMLGTGPEVPIAAKYNSHPITDNFDLLTAYSLARSVATNPAGANNRFAQTLVETSESSWAETEHQGADDVRPRVARHRRG